MPDQKLSLEEILNEYSPNNTQPKTSIGRADTQKIINSTIEESSAPQKEQPKAPVSNEKSELFENAHRQPNPADEYKPADLSKHRISVVGKDSISEIRSTVPRKPDTSNTGTIPAANIAPDEAPMIRRMSDSTRAKELEDYKKNKKKHKKKKNSYTYDKESPDGEYMYTPPTFQKKKRSRAAIIAEAESPEGRKSITDIVPSPAAVEAAKPVEPAPRAEITSIDLTQRGDVSAADLDVHITQEQDEFLSAAARKKRTKRIVDFNYYGDVEDVGRDIFELKSTISVRVVTLLMTSFLSLFITLGNQFGFPMPDFFSKNSHVMTFLLIQLVLGLVSIISSLPVISKGLKKLITFHADSDSMTAVTAISCLAAMIPAFYKTGMVKAGTVNIYMPVGILALLLNSIGKLLIIRRAARNFKFVSRNFDRHAVTYVTDEERAERLTRGTLGDFPILASTRKTDFLTDFLRYTYSSDMTDAYCRKATPACLLASVIIAFLLTFFAKGTFRTMEAAAFGFSIFSMIICATSCIALPFTVNIPLENMAENAFRNKGIMLGYQSVDDFYDTNSILADTDMIFPSGSVNLGGIKVFSNIKIDEALLEAASLTHHAGSIMRQLFKDVTNGREDLLFPIENYSFEENMGMCGWINNKRILFGNRELMTSHNIEGIPTKSKESEYVSEGQECMYLSISGNLAAMFTVDITADKNVKKWWKKLSKRKICVILKSVDPCITQKKLSSLFGVPDDMIRILPKRLHEDFDAETKKSVRLSASMATTGKFSSLAHLLIATKAIHSSAIFGLIIQTVSIFLGFGLSLLMILSKAFESSYIYMSPTALIIYNAACAAATYLAVSLKKV